MSDLDPDFMALFSSVTFASAEDLVDAIGLAKLMPNAIIDAKIFEPCGFSLNAIDKVSELPSFDLHFYQFCGGGLIVNFSTASLLLCRTLQ